MEKEKRRKEEKREKKSHIYRPSWHSTRSRQSLLVFQLVRRSFFILQYIYIYWNFFTWNFDFFSQIGSLRGISEERVEAWTGSHQGHNTNIFFFFTGEKRWPGGWSFCFGDRSEDYPSFFSPAKKCFNRPEGTVNNSLIIYHLLHVSRNIIGKRYQQLICKRKIIFDRRFEVKSRLAIVCILEIEFRHFRQFPQSNRSITGTARGTESELCRVRFRN